MPKVRIYEIEKMLKIENKELIEKMPDWAENHGDSVAADDLGKTGTDPK